MPDLHDDDTLRAMFTTVRAESAAEITPPGMSAVRATVRHRRRVRTAVTWALAAALVVGSAAGYAWSNPGHHRSGPPLASRSPDPSPSIRSTDARAVDLRNATIDIPSWAGGTTITHACPAGTRTFVNGRADAGAGTGGVASYELPAAGTQPVYADLDGQPGDEILVSVGCYGLRPSAPEQLLALQVQRDGTLRTLGSVLTTDDGTLLAYTDDVKVRTADRTVLVQSLGPWQPNGDYPAAHQLGYRYQNGRFRQVEGPTAKPTSASRTTSSPSPAARADLAITSTDVVMSKPDPNQTGYNTSGQQTITVTNSGPARVAGLVVEVAAPTYTRTDQTCRDASYTNPQSGVSVMTCHLGPLNPGQAQTLVLDYVWSGTAIPVTYPWYVKVTPDPPVTDPLLTNNKASYTWSQAS
jgi:hypothetical protein